MQIKIISEDNYHDLEKSVNRFCSGKNVVNVTITFAPDTIIQNAEYLACVCYNE